MKPEEETPRQPEAFTKWLTGDTELYMRALRDIAKLCEIEGE